VRLGLDGTPLLGTRTGVAQVVEGLLRGLVTADDVDVVAYALTGRLGIEDALPAGVRAGSSRLPARLVRELWDRVDRPRVEHWTGPVDVVHATNYVAPPSRSPVVVSVYDLTFVRFPEMCTADTLRYPNLIRRALHRGAFVHVTSDFVGAEVADEFGLDPARIRRVYPGLATVSGGDPARGRALAGADEYVLSLGTVEPRKNLPALVRAFDVLASERARTALVVAGPDGWGIEAFDTATREARARDRITRLGFVPDDDRRDLLAGATVFAYPSVYEGFGFPPLEAMAAGVPVVAGAAGSLPEVLGGAALLVEPSDVDALAGALARAIADPAWRERAVVDGRDRAARYDWPVALQGMLALYRSLL
jgi:glycosyltransferase involved in cell wall biosynthesis